MGLEENRLVTMVLLKAQGLPDARDDIHGTAFQGHRFARYLLRDFRMLKVYTYEVGMGIGRDDAIHGPAYDTWDNELSLQQAAWYHVGS